MPTTCDTPPRRMTAYAVAVLGVVMALALRWPLWPVLGNRVPFILFFPAVMLAASLGGLRPGILATGLASLAALYYLLEPTSSFMVSHSGDLLSLALFAVVGTFISHLAERLRRANAQAGLDAPRFQEGELRYCRSLDSISDAFAQLDTEWRYTYVNARAAQIFGMLPENMLGRTIWELFPAVLGTEMETRCRVAVENGKPAQFEYYFPAFDRWFEQRLYPSESGLAIFSADVTDRKRAGEENARLLAILEATPDLVSTARPDGAIHYLNREARRVFGTNGDGDAEGRQAFLRHPDWAEPVDQKHRDPDGDPGRLLARRDDSSRPGRSGGSSRSGDHQSPGVQRPAGLHFHDRPRHRRSKAGGGATPRARGQVPSPGRSRTPDRMDGFA